MSLAGGRGLRGVTPASCWGFAHAESVVCGGSRSPQYDEDGHVRYRLYRFLTCAREIKDYNAGYVHIFTR